MELAQEFGADVRQGHARSSTVIDVERFWRDGYLIVRNAMPRDQVLAWRQRLQDIKAGGRVTSRGDFLTDPMLRGAILNDPLIATAKAILGDTVLYWGESNALVDGKAWGFHKDNADRLDPKAPDWSVDHYPIIRFGIYTQDTGRDQAGGLDLLAGSHRIPDFTSGTYSAPEISVGDLVVWNLRTTHSAGLVKLKGLGGRYVYGKMFRRIWARLPIGPLLQKLETNRIAMFCTFAQPHALTDRYLEYAKHRTQSWQQWSEIDWPEDLKRQATRRGLTLIDPREFTRDGKPVNADYAPIAY